MGLGTDKSANHGTRGIDTSKISVSVLYLLVLLSYVQVEGASLLNLTSTLHSTEYGLNFAYDGETVKFNCTAEGNSIAWSSDEYIGSDGNRLEFVSIERKGTEYRAGQSVATLINVTNVNGLTILESVLQITVRSAFQISSIQCHNVGSDTVKTISFGINGNISLTCDQRSACPGETVTCTCITGYSNTLAWTSDQLIGPNDARLEFLSIDRVNVIHTVPGSNTSATLTDISRLNGVVVLSSDLTFVAKNSVNILTCVNVGQPSSYSIIVPMSKNCGPVSTPSLSTPDLTASTVTDIVPRSDKSSVTIGVGVLLSTLVIILLLAILMLLIKIIYIQKQYKKVDVCGSLEDRDMNNMLSIAMMNNDDNQSEPATSQESKECNEDENVRASGVDMMTYTAVDTQKEIFKEIQETTRKKKFIDSLVEEIFDNTRNNCEDATGGLKKRAQASKDSWTREKWEK